MNRKPCDPEMNERLRSFYDADGAEEVCKTFRRWIEHPLKRKIDLRRFLLNPILVVLVAFVGLVGATVLFFSWIA